jgi:hypothetical protein
MEDRHESCAFRIQRRAMCFVHVLLNAFDLRDKGWEATIVIEVRRPNWSKNFTSIRTRPSPRCTAWRRRRT